MIEPEILIDRLIYFSINIPIDNLIGLTKKTTSIGVSNLTIDESINVVAETIRLATEKRLSLDIKGAKGYTAREFLITLFRIDLKKYTSILTKFTKEMALDINLLAIESPHSFVIEEMTKKYQSFLLVYEKDVRGKTKFCKYAVNMIKGYHKHLDENYCGIVLAKFLGLSESFVDKGKNRQYWMEKSKKYRKEIKGQQRSNRSKNLKIKYLEGQLEYRGLLLSKKGKISMEKDSKQNIEDDAYWDNISVPISDLQNSKTKINENPPYPIEKLGIPIYMGKETEEELKREENSLSITEKEEYQKIKEEYKNLLEKYQKLLNFAQNQVADEAKAKITFLESFHIETGNK